MYMFSGKPGTGAGTEDKGGQKRGKRERKIEENKEAEEDSG